MKKLFLLFSHTLTEEQKKDAIIHLLIDKFIYLPEDLQQLWSSIQPDKEDIKPSLKPLEDFLSHRAKKGDIVLVQGDFGATYHMVNFCKQNALTPIYSTNKRESSEFFSHEKNRVIKKSTFSHVLYRKY